MSDSTTLDQIGHFTASDGYAFAYRYWAPRSDERGVLVVLHGIQSHSNWYRYSSLILAEAGYHVYFLDRRGAGINQEKRGDAPHADRLINDVVQFSRTLKKKHQLPLTLKAVSWGGILAGAILHRHPQLFQRLMLLYPGIFARIQPKVYQRWGLNLAGLSETPSKYVKVPLSDPALFTAQPEWQEFIRQDEQKLEEVTLSFLIATQQLKQAAQQAAGSIRIPALGMLAGKDRIINNTLTQEFFSEIATPHKKVILYPDAAHSLEFEPNRKEIFADMLDWLRQTECLLNRQA